MISWINGPEAIRWHLVREPSEVVEITATHYVRRAIAEEMGVAHDLELDDLQGATDAVVWAVAARVRTMLRTASAETDFEPLI